MKLRRSVIFIEHRTTIQIELRRSDTNHNIMSHLRGSKAGEDYRTINIPSLRDWGKERRTLMTLKGNTVEMAEF